MLRLLGEARRFRSNIMAGNGRPEERAAALLRMDNKIAKLDESWYTTMCKTRELRQESERVSKEIGLELGMIKMLVALVAGREQAFKMTGEWKDWQDKTVRSSMATLHETGEATAVQAPSGGLEGQKVEGEGNQHFSRDGRLRLCPEAGPS